MTLPRERLYTGGMRRTSYAGMDCSIAAALDVVGEPWTLLIVRDAMYGVRRFDDFQANLGIARNVLTSRLRRLVEAGVFRRVPYQQHPLRYEYRLTDKGAALFQVIVGLKEWGDRYGTSGDGGRPMELVDRITGAKVQPSLIDAATGNRLDLSSVHAVAGSGASEATRTFFSRLEYARSHRRRSGRQT